MKTDTLFRTLIISTGGTIEKTFDERIGALENRDSVLEDRILKKLRLPYGQVNIEKLMSKDSLYMTDEDRQVICHTLEKNLPHYDSIVVIHGTDTMDLTSKYCFEKIVAPKIPIIFTGAMRPLEFEDTDAVQNVIEALYAGKLVAPGIYLSFHGKLFWGNKARKDREKGTFAEVV